MLRRLDTEELEGVLAHELSHVAHGTWRRDGRPGMKTMRHHAGARVAAIGIAASGALLLVGCGAANEGGPSSGGGGSAVAMVSGTISGAGASTQQAATQAWVAGFTAINPDAVINYDPTGSGAGRTQFMVGGVDWAGSDAYLEGDELGKANQRCGSGGG